MKFQQERKSLMRLAGRVACHGPVILRTYYLHVVTKDRQTGFQSDWDEAEYEVRGRLECERCGDVVDVTIPQTQALLDLIRERGLYGKDWGTRRVALSAIRSLRDERRDTPSG